MSAMTVPLPKAKVNEWKAWARELEGPRKGEFDDFNERMGLTEHRAFLDLGPQGPQVIVVHGGPGEEDFLQRLARSDHAFDRWFRERISDLHGMDFAHPPQGEAAQEFLAWRARPTPV